MNTLKQLLQNNEGTIVDVRTPAEFRGGHVAGSVNIPVGELMHRLSELKELKQPLILCCASGGRSAMASHLLKQNQITCVDAGSWLSLNYLQAQTVSTL